MRRFFAFAILVALSWSAPAGADTYPAHPDLFVNDHARVLDPAAEDGLRATLAALKAETGIEMTVLTIRSRDDYDSSASIEAFATGLFNDWGIGRADRNDGILVLVATADREMRIELGSAYNQDYDVLAQDIIGRFYLPDFRAGDYQSGIVAGTGETIARIARRHAARLPAEALPKTEGGMPGWLPIVAIAVVGGLISARRRIADASFALRRCPSCGRLGMRRGRDILTAATAEAAGRGVERTTCRHCDFHEDRDYTIPTRSASDGGGGGFGGGRSSGGGATGRW